MHTCAYCGRRLSWFHRVVGQLRFCSKEHARLHGIRGAAADAQAESSAGRPLANGDACAMDSTMADAACSERTAPPASETRCPSEDCWLGEAPDPILEDAPERVPPGFETAGCKHGEGDADWAGGLEGYGGNEGVAAAIDEPGEHRVPDCRDMLPLPAAAPMAAGHASLCWMPPRPPRRRIIVPSHRPHRTPPGLPQAEEIPASAFLRPLKPPAEKPGPMPKPICPARQAATAALPRRDRRHEAESGLRGPSDPAVVAAVEHLAPFGARPVPPAGQSPAPQPHPLWHEAGISTPASRPPGPARLGPVAAVRATVSPLPLPALERNRRIELAGLMHAGIQPFRLHRPPHRPLCLRPGLTIQPEPLREWPRLVRSAVSDLLFVPRPTAMPLRPSYAFGPPSGGEAVAADASGLQAARRGPLMPPGKIARG